MELNTCTGVAEQAHILYALPLILSEVSFQSHPFHRGFVLGLKGSLINVFLFPDNGFGLLRTWTGTMH